MSGMSLREMLSCGGRGSGKTYGLVQACLATGGTLVVANESQARQLRQQFPNLKVVSSGSSQRLIGSKGPVFVDHFEVERQLSKMEDAFLAEVELARKESEEKK